MCRPFASAYLKSNHRISLSPCNKNMKASQMVIEGGKPGQLAGIGIIVLLGGSDYLLTF